MVSRPQHDAISPRRDDGRGETKLRVVVADPDDARRDPARPVVDREPRAVGDRLELLERHLEAVGAREGTGGDERVTAADVAALDTGQAGGDALTRRGALHRDVVHLDGPHPHVAAGRLQPELVARADRPRPERPGDDGPDPDEREDAVDEEPRREVGPALLDVRRDFGERRPELVEPCPGDAADRDDRRAGNELASLLDRELQRLLVDGVRLRDCDDAVVDPEEPEDREMLVGLRPRALRRVDDEQEEVDARGARDHRPDEPLVTRDVDERERRAVRELEGRVAEVDRDAAGTLLGQPVGVLARERPDEGRLPVVDVTRGADGQRHALRPAGRRSTARAASSTSDSASVRASSSSRPSRTMPTHGRVAEPKRRGELLLDRAGGARQLRERERPAADAGDGLLDLAADEPRQALGSRANAPRPARRACGAPESPPRARSGSSCRASVPSSAASVSLSARSARCSGWRRRRSTSSARPTTMPACGPAEQLVAGEADEVGAGGDARRGGRLVPERRAASPSRGRRRAAGRPRARSRASSSVVELLA